MTKIIFALVFYALSLGALQAKQVENLASHMAVYNLRLENATDGAGMAGLSGRMVYEFKNSACEGYATRTRFVTKVEMEDAPPRLTDQQASDFESFDGKEFRFSSKTIIDNQVNNEVNGVAKVENGEMVVDLQKPTTKQHKLPLALFPSVLTQDVIKQAKAGKHFYRTTLFDGTRFDDTQKSDKITDVIVVIGTKKTPIEDSETKVMGKVGEESYWPVTLSYYTDDENQDGLPSYRTSFLLYENGITRDLFMDYGDFSLTGKLINLQMFDASPDGKECK